MKEPATPEELLEQHKILRSDPKRYLEITNQWIRDNPNNSHAYFSRHQAWMRLDQPHRALDDLNKVIELQSKPHPISFLSRGEVYRHLGEHQKAINDFDRGEAIDREKWQGDVLGLLYRADSYAQLGNEKAALADCARLPDDFWTPGLNGAPAGDRTQVAAELRRIAAKAR